MSEVGDQERWLLLAAPSLFVVSMISLSISVCGESADFSSISITLLLFFLFKES